MNKKLIILSLILFFTISTRSQTQNCKITGNINEPSLFKYACLYISKTKKLSITPIIANKFQFDIEKQQEEILGIVFLGLDSLNTCNDVKQNGITGFRASRMIALEDMTICVQEDIRKAAIYGGRLNKDLDQMNTCSRSLDFKPFFQQHPDSPIALIFLKSLSIIGKKPLFAGYVDCKSYYNDLSDRLKNSTEGKEVWAKIND